MSEEEPESENKMNKSLLAYLKKKRAKKEELDEILIRLRERLTSAILVSPVIRRMSRMAAAKSFGLGPGALFSIEPIFKTATYEDLFEFYAHHFHYQKKSIFIDTGFVTQSAAVHHPGYN